MLTMLVWDALYWPQDGKGSRPKFAKRIFPLDGVVLPRCCFDRPLPVVTEDFLPPSLHDTSIFWQLRRQPVQSPPEGQSNALYFTYQMHGLGKGCVFLPSTTLFSQRMSQTVKQGLNLLSPELAQFRQFSLLCAFSFSTFPYGVQTVCVCTGSPQHPDAERQILYGQEGLQYHISEILRSHQARFLV